MKAPIIFGAVSLEDLKSKEYEVVKAAWTEEDCPQYAIIHRRTGIVEFTSENSSFVLDWLTHFTGQNREPEPDFAKLVAVEAAKKAN